MNKLKNKLNIPEFEEFVHNYDLLMCAEIKVGYLDFISVNGYTFHCSKLVKTSHKAGGVGIFIRNDFIDDSEIFDTIVCTSMELLEHFNVHNICLTGDFNARTGSIDDFVFMDEIVSKSNPIVSDLVKDCLALPNYDIDVLRHKI